MCADCNTLKDVDGTLAPIDVYLCLPASPISHSLGFLVTGLLRRTASLTLDTDAVERVKRTRLRRNISLRTTSLPASVVKLHAVETSL